MQIVMIAIFLSVLALTLLAVGVGSRFVEEQRKKEVAGVLRTLDQTIVVPNSTVLFEREDHVKGDTLGEILAQFSFTRRIEEQLQQAGLDWTVSRFFVSTVIAAGIGFLLGLKFRVFILASLSAVALGLVCGLLPWLYIVQKRKKRMDKFEEQLPEALDFLARALRAGHAFTVSLEMLSVESPEPLRGEFKKIYNEQNLGESVPVALRHLADRVPLLDVRFFVSAVLMQRDTGGNLGEILTKLSGVIRDRFKLKGQVRAISAHGRITALILTVLPIVTTLLLMLIAPEYLPTMAKDPTGKILIIGAVLGQLVGYLIMRKIINIKV